jgi:hypothetical protein
VDYDLVGLLSQSHYARRRWDEDVLLAIRMRLETGSGILIAVRRKENDQEAEETITRNYWKPRN